MCWPVKKAQWSELCDVTAILTVYLLPPVESLCVEVGLHGLELISIMGGNLLSTPAGQR